VHAGVRRGKRYNTWLQSLAPDVRNEFLRRHVKNLVEDGLLIVMGDDE
jgi:DNA-binding HxlR family transcriptional regulator